MNRFVYSGNKTKEISFPLGGIGTGSIGLAGNGRLIDWEIFNRPSKGTTNGFSHFAIKAESEEKVVDARIINGDIQPPYIGDFNRSHFEGFGFGTHRTSMAGMPHFRNAEFMGEYPLAKLKFEDEKFPGSVSMLAFNPFIPLNDKDSSIPAAFFEIEIINTTEKEMDYTVAASLSNPFSSSESRNSYTYSEAVHFIKLESIKRNKNEPEYGDLCIATDAEKVSHQEYWLRGKWFDNLTAFWRNFCDFGSMIGRRYTENPPETKEHSYGVFDVCTLAAHTKLSSGEKKKIRFIISWSFPNMYNYWNPENSDRSFEASDDKNCGIWKNYYATVFVDSAASARYCLKNWNRLYEDTLLFKEALFNTTLPKEAIDAISANLSILKSPTCLRLEDGSFYGFEGCHHDEGCCEGSCTHVWNYAYSLPFLFPKLERSMRDLDFKYNQRSDGAMSFRLQLPLGRERWNFRSCVDGQFGGVIKAYRDWKISGDSKWLKSNWEAIKNSLEFAWAKTNEDKWDFDKDGVLEGRQHHTLDMELFGPNSWLNGFYLAALKAGAEMAGYFGEKQKEMEYSALFEKGKKWVDQHLFNGEYYQQKVNLKDKEILERFQDGVSLHGDSTLEAYWNDEVGEIKYQIGDGCEIDQVTAQWHANLCGLGEIFDKVKAKKALRSIYRHNFKKSMRDIANPCRLYSLNDEKGVIICEWPEENYKPLTPLTYAEETMNGFEYAVASHMLQEGFLKEAMEIVKAIRDRYDGEKRNPWNEFECGSNYARSMASYALLLSFSGFEYDMVKGIIGFNPIQSENEEFRCFWSLDSGWGNFELKNSVIEIKVMYGEITLNKIKLPFLANNEIQSVNLNDNEIAYVNKRGILEFNKITIKKDGLIKVLKRTNND